MARINTEHFTRFSPRWEKFISRRRPLWLRCLGALGIFGLALPFMPLLVRYHSIGVATLNLAAAILAAVYGGLGPGLLVALLSALSVDYFLVAPVGKVMTSAQDFFFIMSYLALTSFMCLLVSSLRQAYRNAQDARKDAEKAVSARESVLAIVSHDLRNPVSSAALNCQLMRKSLKIHDKETVLKCIGRIERSTQQMDRLIQDLMDATRIDSGNLKVAFKSSDILPVVREAMAALETLANHQGLSLFLEAESELPPLSFDRDRIHQVLSNLIGNAIKFTPTGGSITVNVHPLPGFVQVSVRDTGAGIRLEELPRVFERHWQARETAQKGAGLGLYIAKGIINAHGGRMTAESEPGKGSCFSFTLAQQSGDHRFRNQARDQELPALGA